MLVCKNFTQSTAQKKPLASVHISQMSELYTPSMPQVFEISVILPHTYVPLLAPARLMPAAQTRDKIWVERFYFFLGGKHAMYYISDQNA